MFLRDLYINLFVEYIRTLDHKRWCDFEKIICRRHKLIEIIIIIIIIILQVKITALNDSHLIGMCLYNVVVLSAVCLTLNLVLEDRISVRYGIMSGILIIGTTSTQLIVFVPKVS